MRTDYETGDLGDKDSIRVFQGLDGCWTWQHLVRGEASKPVIMRVGPDYPTSYEAEEAGRSWLGGWLDMMDEDATVQDDRP